MNRAQNLLIILLSPLAVGCSGGPGGSADDFTAVEVRGKVTMKNRPVSGAIITLVPVPGGGSSHEAMGEVKSGGTFALRTAGKPGAEPGKYTAHLEKLNGKDMPTGDAPPTVEIPAGGGDVNVAFP